MVSPERKPRGRPFQSGNPSRPPGSKNKVTQALEQLAEGQAEQVFQKVTEQALAGDVSSQKIFLDRVYPPAKGRPINVRTNKSPTGRALRYCRHFQRDPRRPAHTG
jgi:Family of unknown function (DUF5681)